MHRAPTIVAVVPVFAPDDAVPDRLARLAAQVDAVVVVDDGVAAAAPAFVDRATAVGARVLPHRGNRGIATALNDGIREARALGATHVLTVDQDTDLPADYTTRALDAFGAADADHRIGATVVDAVNGVPSIPTWLTAAGAGLVPEAIQTGMLIAVACIDDAGAFEDDLVIDCVDTEFCHRIRAAGWSIAITEGTDVAHELGRDIPMRPFGVLWRRGGVVRTYQWHAPFRQYTIVRNNLVLARRFRDAEPIWADAVTARIRLESAKKIVCGPARIRHAIATMAGVVHGRAGRLGPMPAGLRRVLVGRDRSRDRRGDG